MTCRHLRANLVLSAHLLLIMGSQAVASSPNLIPATEYLKYYANHTVARNMTHKTRSDVMCAVIRDASAGCIGFSYDVTLADQCILYAELEPMHLLTVAPGNQDGVIIVWLPVAKYVGCWRDDKHDRALPMYNLLGELASPQNCVILCKAEGYEYAGLQYERECFCGDNYWRYGKSPESDCNKSCLGDSGVNCGGDNRNSVYKA